MHLQIAESTLSAWAEILHTGGDEKPDINFAWPYTMMIILYHYTLYIYALCMFLLDVVLHVRVTVTLLLCMMHVYVQCTCANLFYGYKYMYNACAPL